MISIAPSFRLGPRQSRKLKRFWLNTNIAGLIFVRITLPFITALPNWLLHTASLYNIMAFITVFSLDPTRLPEAAATRIKQRRAWIELVRWLPLLAVCVSLFAWASDVPMRHFTFPSIGAVTSIYMDELLFRNIIQPKLRALGLSKYTAIFAQSLLFGVMFLSKGFSEGILCIAFILGLFNGWLVYKFRSLWPPFILSLVVHIIYLGY